MDLVEENSDLLKTLPNENTNSVNCKKEVQKEEKEETQQFIDHEQHQNKEEEKEKVQQEIINTPQKEEEEIEVEKESTIITSKPLSSNSKKDKNDNLNKDLTLINGFKNEHKQEDSSKQHKNKLSLLNSNNINTNNNNNNNNDAYLVYNNKFESNLNNNNKLETNTESITPVGLLIENKEETKDNTEKTNKTNINSTNNNNNNEINNNISKDLEVVLEEEGEEQQQHRLENKDSADCKLNQMKFLQPNSIKTNPLDSRTRSVSIDNSNLKLKLPGQIDNIYSINNNNHINNNFNINTISNNNNNNNHNFHNPNNYNNINSFKQLNSNLNNNHIENNQNDLVSSKTVIPASKYIRKIQNTIYDRERASSTESIHKLINNTTNYPTNAGLKFNKSLFNRQNVVAPIALPETLNESSFNEINLPSDLDLNDSTSSSQQQQQQQLEPITKKYSDLSLPNSKLNNNKYVKYLRNLQEYNNNTNKTNTASTRSDSMDNLKRTSSLIRPDQSFIRSDQLPDKMPSTLTLINSNGYYNSQIDKIREKFARISEKTSTPPILSITPAPALLSPTLITNLTFNNNNNNNTNTNYTNKTNLIINRNNINNFKTTNTDNSKTNNDNNSINITNLNNFIPSNTTTNQDSSLNDYYNNNNTNSKTTAATLSTNNTSLLKKDSPKILKKYQKSKTSDLSEYLFENEIYNNNNQNYYYTNNNSTRNTNNELIENPQPPPPPSTITTTQQASSTKLEDLLDQEYSQIQQQQPPPPPRKTSIKSILKSPSSINDKCFEDLFTKRASLELDQTTKSPPPGVLLKSYLNDSNSNRNRIFVKSPTPVREIPLLEEEENEEELLINESNNNHLLLNDQELNSNLKNRNRFNKKKPSLRSKSVEFSLSLLNLNNTDLLMPNNSYTMSNQSNRDNYMQSQLDDPSSSRPSLMRQNALAKSLGENLDKIPMPNDPHIIMRHQQPQSTNRVHKSHGQNQHNHRQRYSRYHRNRKNNQSFSSTSLTSSSSSFSSDSSYDKYRNDKKNLKTKPIDPIRLNRKHDEKYNYSSDDSVCGIPKRRSSHRLCTNGGKPFHKSMDELGYRAANNTNNTNENSLNEQDYYNRNSTNKSSQMDTLNYLDTSNKFKSSHNNNGFTTTTTSKVNPPNNLNISTSISNLNNPTMNNNNFYLMKKSPINNENNQSFTNTRTYRDASLNSLNTNNSFNNKFNYSNSNNTSNFSNNQLVDKQINSNMSQKVMPQHMSLRNINDSGNNGLIQGPNSMSTGLMKTPDVSFMKNNPNNFSSTNTFMLQNNSSNFYPNQPQQQQKQLPSYSQLSIPNMNQNIYNQSKQLNSLNNNNQFQQQQQQPQMNKSSSLISSTSPLQYYDNNKNDTKNYDSWIKEKRVVSVSPTNTPIISLSAKQLMGSSSVNNSQTALNKQQQQQKQSSNKMLNTPISNKNLLTNSNNTNNNNKTFNLYSLLNPQHQRITQPYQQHLLNHANLTKEEQELEEQFNKQDKQTDTTTTTSSSASNASQQKKNQLNYQKTISKSFDTSSLKPSNDENKNNTNTTISSNDLSNKLFHQKQQYQPQSSTIKEEEMPQQSAAMQEKLKRFEQDTAKINANYENIKQNKYYDTHEKKSSLIEDNQKLNTSLSNNANNAIRKKSPFETNKENSPINTTNNLQPTKQGQFNSQQTHTFQSVQQQQQQPINNTTVKRPVSINPNVDSTSKQGITFPFQSNLQSNQQQQQSYYYNPQNKTQQQSNSTAKLTDVSLSPARVPQFTNSNYKYSQLTAPYSSSTTAVSPINLTKQTNYFQKSSTPPNQVNANLANATSAAAEALKQQQQQQQQQLQRTDNQLRQLNTKQDNVSMIPKSPSQAFNTNYEIIQSSWGNSSSNDLSGNSGNKSKPAISSPQPEYLPDQFVPASVSKRAALFEQQKQQEEQKRQLELLQQQQQQQVQLQKSLSPLNQSLESSRRNSFNKSTISPVKLVQSPSLTKTQEDGELLSSSSSSSYKDNFKRNQLAINSTNNNNNNSNNKNELVNQEESTSQNEPSKLSMSEKMKLFSNTNQTTTTTTTTSTTTSQQQQQPKVNKPQNKRSLNNRFQTQPISQAELEYATDNLANKNIDLIRHDLNDTAASCLATSGPTYYTSNKLANINTINNNTSVKKAVFEPLQPQGDNLVRSNKNISFDFLNKSKIMDSASSSQQQQQHDDLLVKNDTTRDIKRYKNRSKTDDTSLLVGNQNSEYNTDNMDINKKANELDNGEVVIMSIQERMAALKKSGEEEWKKRNAASQLHNQQQQSQAEPNEPSNSISSIKQHQHQLKQQLIGMGGKPLPKLNLSSELKRAILAPLNDNIDNEDEKSRQSSKYDNDQNDNQDSIVTQSFSEKREKRLPPGAKIIFNPSDLNADLEKALFKNKKKTTQSNTSDTESMLKPTNKIPSSSSQQQLNERVELFSTDSEMDSFFKENEFKNYKYNDLFSSSSAVASPQNDEIENDEEFDRIVSEAQRLTQGARPKPVRKAKSKGNHLKNLHNRIEIKNEYEQNHVPLINSQVELGRNDKSSV